MIITDIERNKLIKAQQEELDAVILYRRLSELIPKHKETFLKVAADEGKHAGILRKYTQVNLQAKSTKASLVAFIYKIFGLKRNLNILSKGEIRAAKDYYELVEKFPDIQTIIKDEELHGRLMKNLC